MNTHQKIPSGWHQLAHQLWLSGKRQDAIQETLKILNHNPDFKPKGLIFQLAYYLYLINDFQSSCVVLKQGLKYYPIIKV